MKKVSVIAAAVVGALASGVVMAEDKVQEGWQVNGYGHLLYNVGQSLALNETWEHRRDYRAAGAPFSGNPNQVEFTVTKGNNYDNGSWSKYVLKTEYGNNEGGNGRGFYGSSSGNEGHLETGQLEFKEAYVELGDLSYFAEGMSIWTGKRYLNRQAGIITKEFWKQSSGVGGGVQYNDMGIAVMSADSGEGSCYDPNNGGNTSCKNNGLDDQQRSTTMTTVDLYFYGVEGLGGRFDFDAKLMTRANVEAEDTAKDGYGLAVTYSRDYYGFDGWTTTALTYGKGVAANRGVNFGQWSGNWQKDDQSLFFTSYGVANLSDNWQLGTELTIWNLQNDEGTIFGSQKEITRGILGVMPTYKVNENFRVELLGTYAIEDLENPGAWSRPDNATHFYSATLAPVFTVNADYWGRPQIKPYVSYMSSSLDSYRWSNGASDSSEARFGVEAEIWF